MTKTLETRSRSRRLSRLALTTAFLLGGAIALGVTPTRANPEAGATPAIDDLVASLEGGWMGAENDTPFGKMSFAMLFEWTEDGSLHSRSSLNSETYIDLRFEKDADGVWLLHEEAAMEGLGVQKYSLTPDPTASQEATHRWIWAQDPDFLSIELGLEDENMTLAVFLRSRPHVTFRLAKQPESTWAEMKRHMLAQSKVSPEDGTSIAEVVSRPPAHLSAKTGSEGTDDPIDPIAAARQKTVSAPDDAKAHLALAQQLGAAINDDPANGPRYAFEMLSSLKTAVALDSQLTAAYHHLVGYYLNAPPIAGGSIAMAEETARALAEYDPEGGQQLLAQIETIAASRSAQASGESSN